MKFIDEAIITVQSGNGGKGCVSFRREKFVPKGGPNGGDGGKGGDVILVATSRRRTLYHFRFQRQFSAKNGGNGQGSQKTGRNGADLVIEIPPGTIVCNTETNEIIKDLTEDGDRFVIAKGGRGGMGNKHFATSTNRTPRFAQPGESGQLFSLRLELKLLADVGIIGFPNAGKSTLIRAVSSANPKIGDYPFTTLTPTLGVVRPSGAEPFVAADIPGLIEGAHQGAGLGDKFLRHIERTRILLHLIDAASVDAQCPLFAYNTVNKELALYNPSLTEKPQIVVLNKMDKSGAKEGAEAFMSALKGKDVFLISAISGDNIDAVILKIVEMLKPPHVTSKK